MNNTFENMKLCYRNQLPIQKLLSYLGPEFFKCSEENIVEEYCRKKMLAIYILIKYSKSSLESIANELNVPLDAVYIINKYDNFRKVYNDDIRAFFKQFEEECLT